jgi:putative ribosome biogenesis GTPase RsgA
MKEIIEIQGAFPKMAPVKEKFGKYIEGIDKNVLPFCRNGEILLLCGPAGSGKSSLLLSLFAKQSKNKLLRKKFNNIYYFCPHASMASVANHPFEKHDKIYHELTVPSLEGIYEEMMERKEEREKEEDDSMEYNCLVIDDLANELKDKHITKFLTKLLIKTRHVGLYVIICLQSYLLLPKQLRKLIWSITMFKPRNHEEFYTLNKELMNMKNEDAQKLYDYCYDKEYTHMDYDAREGNFYKNFNKLEF